jgi:hypothetical protein
MDGTIDKWVGNVVSGAAIFGSFLGWLPGIAAFIAFVWYLIQIYESATVQRWLAARRLRRIAALKAKIVVLEALNQLPSLSEKTDN